MMATTQAADLDQPFAGALLPEDGGADSALNRVGAEMTRLDLESKASMIAPKRIPAS